MAVGVGEGHIKSLLNNLLRDNVIIRDGCYYEFNKDFDRWRVSRADGYKPEILTELVSLNLNTGPRINRKSYRIGKFWKQQTYRIGK